MKKLLCALLSLSMLFALGTMAVAAGDEAITEASISFVTPRGVLYDQNISVSGEFVSNNFTTGNTSQDGNSIRYWFKNEGTENCKVELYKKGTFGSSLVSSMTVSPSASGGKYTVYKASSRTTYYLKVTSTYGGAVKGHLRANQIDA